jgi:hypothetical protein
MGSVARRSRARHDLNEQVMRDWLFLLIPDDFAAYVGVLFLWRDITLYGWERCSGTSNRFVRFTLMRSKAERNTGTPIVQLSVACDASLLRDRITAGSTPPIPSSSRTAT